MPGLLDLPPELRDEIYSYVVSPYGIRHPLSDGETYLYDYSSAVPLLRVNRQIYRESRKVFYALNTFVRIRTPWEQARYYVAHEGNISIIPLGDEVAARFNSHSLLVTIEASYSLGDSEYDGPAMHEFVVLVQTGDLARFCRSWYYSSINMPALNGHLTLTLALRDPYTSSSPFPAADGTATPSLPRGLQSRLLDPFGQIKGLQKLVIAQPDASNHLIAPAPDVYEKLVETMNIPLDPPHVCLTRATALKEAGNAALAANRFADAITHYNAAFHEIHILINGKDRRVHGDQFFERTITAPGAFQGQHAGTARTILRVRLVANTVLAYLKMKDYEMAIHTGMRTIGIIRGSIGLDEEDGANDPTMEAMLGFPAAGEMGKIYYRTGMAFKAMDETAEARKLLKVAAVYLPHDKIVERDLASVALRLS
ncbi:hypothetical protein Dda_7161 [Drechslerella dactyloides]|uniref:Uncharacterized protein n=1 Tax=Drechslerella dactyloides TaxID=74499 RepID=A0AAD6ITS6_DREDA|nr:hypothetical protein Dda_7161 [Drechslerella dactyloides]